MYARLFDFLKKYIKSSTLFKWGFNYSPMYRRSTGRVIQISDNLHQARVKIPLNWKNANYVGSIFGGSLSSATDPIYMIQLLQILGKEYVVWDKSATIRFKRPAMEAAYADFIFSREEIADIKQLIKSEHEVNLEKKLNITNENGKVVFAELCKTIYIANKKYYKAKKKQKEQATNSN